MPTAHGNSSLPPGRQRFTTTRWSLVFNAAGDSSDAREALESLCGRYWYPLYAYVRHRGYPAADAKDLTQDFFAHLLEKESLKAADPDRGRFRSFLLTAFNNFISKRRDFQNAQKRGGGIRHLSIDFDSGEQRYLCEPVDGWTPEKIFERRWALTLLDTVLSRLGRAYQEEGKAELFESCKEFLAGGAPDYEGTANALGMSVGALRVAVHRLRARYRELLKGEVADTIVDRGSTDDELHCLRRALRGEGS
jgi:RNA polymerase sigma-70 factor (ECF subfamily)